MNMIKVVFRVDGESKIYKLGEFPPDQVQHIVQLAKNHGAMDVGVEMEVVSSGFDIVDNTFEILLCPKCE